MKKNISIILATMLALTAFASGCSNSAPANETPAATEAATEAPAETEAATEAVTEPEVPETEAPATGEDLGVFPDQASKDAWDLIQRCGFKDGVLDGKDVSYSKLAYLLKSDTLQDNGDCYSIQASFYRDVTVSPDIKEGESVTFTTDELNGTTVTAVRKGDELINVEDDGDIYSYYTQEGSTEDVTLTQYSDDVVGCLIYEGTLLIKKDAIHGIDIMREFREITEDDLKNDGYFNGVEFNEDGMVTALVFFGD